MWADTWAQPRVAMRAAACALGITGGEGSQHGRSHDQRVAVVLPPAYPLGGPAHTQANVSCYRYSYSMGERYAV